MQRILKIPAAENQLLSCNYATNSRFSCTYAAPVTDVAPPPGVGPDVPMVPIALYAFDFVVFTRPSANGMTNHVKVLFHLAQNRRNLIYRGEIECGA